MRHVSELDILLGLKRDDPVEVIVCPGRCVTWGCSNAADGRECPEHAAEPLPKTPYELRQREAKNRRLAELRRSDETVRGKERKRKRELNRRRRKDPAYRERENARRRERELRTRRARLDTTSNQGA